MTHEPADAAARRRIRDDRIATLFVEAGAGTGKTTALVARIVALVTDGSAALGQIAAITFTDAAAAELRDRVRLAFELAADDDSDPVARDRCTAALDDLDDAALTTLHAFAQRILAEHPLAAGLPPRFEVLDAVASADDYEQAAREFFDTLLADDQLAPTLQRARTLGIRLPHLRAVAAGLHESWDRVPDVDRPPPVLPPVATPAVLAAADALVALQAHCTADDDRLCADLDDLRADLPVLRAAVDPLDRIDALAALHVPRATLGRKGNWSCDVEIVRAQVRAVAAAHTAALVEQRRAVIAALTPHFCRFARADAIRRRHEGRLGFHDLLVLARDVVRDNGSVRAALRRRYRHVLVDEFQDTDPLQVELVELLGADAGDGGAPRLFFVGDPKQSIYRFRRADLGAYERVRTTCPDGRVALVENFRSDPGIIDFVNAAFAALLGPGEPGLQAQHAPLVAAREPLPGASTTVHVFGEALAVPAAEIRRREAEAVAAVAQRIVAEGWPVLDRASMRTRPARLGDIALLLPTRTALPAIERALQTRDLSARIESRSLVFASAEVRDLVSILGAIDDPTDEVAVVAALRTPAFGCRDRELLAWRDGGGSWDYRRPAPPGPPGAVVEAMHALADLHQRGRWTSVADLLDAIVGERGLRELAVAHRRPRDRWRRTHYLLDQARAWDEQPGHTRRGFLEWVQLQDDEQARINEHLVSEPDDDALRILTVHGAKGLEFPIVVVAGLSAPPQHVAPPVLFTAAGPEISLGPQSSGNRSPGYEAGIESERAGDDAERVRTLYVALTRARDHLVVSVARKETRGNGNPTTASLATRLSSVLEAAGRVLPTLAEAEAGAGVHPPTTDATGNAAPDPTSPLTPAALDAWTAARADVLARAARPASISATAIAAARHELAAGAEGRLPGFDADARFETLAEPRTETHTGTEVVEEWRRGRGATAVGRAVHALLQHAELDAPERLDPTAAAAHAIAEGVGDLAPEVATLARSIAASPAVQAATSARHWREVPLTATIEGRVVEGFVDLLAETPSGFLVIDYKTDHTVSTADRTRLAEEYAPQMAAYALALEAAGFAVAGCVLVFASEPRAVEFPITDLASASEQVRAVLRAG